MKKTKKFWAVLAAAGLLAASFAGCGSNALANAGSSSGSAASSSAEGSSASDSGEKKVIKAVTSGTLAPYFYVNDDNELTGVDIDIVKEVFNRLPQYEFQIENMELANISVALDAKKVSIGSQQFEKNPEREKKYLFTNKGFASYNKRLVYKKGRDDIHSIDDLAGKKVSAGQGSNTAAILETYNAEHDNKIDIVYSNGATSESIYDDVMNGRLDAIVATKKTFKKYNEAFGGGYDINEDSYFSESQAYFMLAQGEEQLRDDMDTALKAMKEDGTLTKLSIEYTGSDYNSEE